jgi:hypothetical protein
MFQTKPDNQGGKMVVYYFKKNNTIAKSYIRQCIIDAFRSEDIEPDKYYLDVFSESKTFKEQGFLKAVLKEAPVKRINIKINYRMHRNGMKYGIYRKHTRKDGVPKLHLIKYIQAVIGGSVDKKAIEKDQDMTRITADNVKNFFLCAYPDGDLFLSSNKKYVANVSPDEADYRVYKNKKIIKNKGIDDADNRTASANGTY